MAKPNITFIVPARFFTDKESLPYLPENIYRDIKRQLGNPDAIEELQSITLYRIVLQLYSSTYFEYQVPTSEIKKKLKELMPFAKSVGFEKEFIQTKGKAISPYINIELYLK